MSISPFLLSRNEGKCELCNQHDATTAYLVEPKADEDANKVALCQTCLSNLSFTPSDYWRIVEGSIWSTTPSVQALSYRILQIHAEKPWSQEVLSMVEIDEPIINWAMKCFEQNTKHIDAFGNTLENGDNVVLIQALNVKGTNFTASKGTVVKKIRLVADNPEQIEGKINEQMIVILTKYLKKN